MVSFCSFAKESQEMKKTTSSPPLQEYFTEVPPRYDFINRLMTWGLDQRYRKRMASMITNSDARSFLDVGTGTGDLVYQVGIRDKKDLIALSGLDFSHTMLEKAAEKTATLQHSPVSYHPGDAAAMPFSDKTFDAAGTAYAFRNMMFMNTKTDKILNEYYRILKPGGKLYALETSQPAFAPVRWVFHIYMYFAAAFLGGLISGNYKAYKYLAWSTSNFHNRTTITKMMKGCGFSEVTHFPLLFGMMAITVATK